jgi:hypothetical protein
MDYILEIFKNTVAILIAMRIAVIVGLILIVIRFIYNYTHASSGTSSKILRKKADSRYIDLKHR